MADAINIPPPSASVINLAYADLIIYIILLLPTIWITWKHGKAGMVCWQIFLSYFALRFTSDIYQIVHRHDPEIPNKVIIMTNAGSIACLSLSLIGIVYEVNIILPLPPKRWTEKIILGITHLANTGGIGIATYGGAPSATAPGGVVSQNLNQIGNCMMLFVMFALCWWMWPTWKRVMAVPSHPNFRPARFMLIAACAGLPFQLIRLAYNTTYAFDHVASLDPVMGSFATRLILMFGMQLGVAICLVAGGWLGMNVVPKSKLPPQATENVLLRDTERCNETETNSSGAELA